MTDGLSALRTYRVPWAELLEKVFAVDVLACPECGGRLGLIAFIADAAVVARILEHLGLDATGPPQARAEVPEEAARAGARTRRSRPRLLRVTSAAASVPPTA